MGLLYRSYEEWVESDGYKESLKMDSYVPPCVKENQDEGESSNSGATYLIDFREAMIDGVSYKINNANRSEIFYKLAIRHPSYSYYVELDAWLNELKKTDAYVFYITLHQLDSFSIMFILKVYTSPERREICVGDINTGKAEYLDKQVINSIMMFVDRFIPDKFKLIAHILHDTGFFGIGFQPNLADYVDYVKKEGTP